MKALDRQAAFARIRARIMRMVELHAPTGCWLYRGRLNNKGYAVMSIWFPGEKTPRKIFVHRASWEAWRCRKMPAGRVGAHDLACVSRACVAPHHIRATTQSHNERDKWREPPYGKDRSGIRVEWPPTHTITTRKKTHERRAANA